MGALPCAEPASRSWYSSTARLSFSRAKHMTWMPLYGVTFEQFLDDTVGTLLLVGEPFRWWCVMFHVDQLVAQDQHVSDHVSHAVAADPDAGTLSGVAIGHRDGGAHSTLSISKVGYLALRVATSCSKASFASSMQ